MSFGIRALKKANDEEKKVNKSFVQTLIVGEEDEIIAQLQPVGVVRLVFPVVIGVRMTCAENIEETANIHWAL